MADIVTSYRNPDLDGVASALVVAAASSVFDGVWTAIFSGELNPETKAALSYFLIEEPLVTESGHEIERVFLVDTHHPPQLPEWVLPDAVTNVIDHHPSGDPAAFPRAVIQNEPVGAAATLVAERLGENISRISSNLRGLLAAAIHSNTLGFRAPSTTVRDHEMFRQLVGPSLPRELEATLRKGREALLAGSTYESLLADVKVRDWRGKDIAVAQTEAPGAITLLDRDDLQNAVAEAVHSLGMPVVWNIVDQTLERTAVVASEPELRQLFGTAADEVTDDAVWFERIALRKTDIFPLLDI